MTVLQPYISQDVVNITKRSQSLLCSKFVRDRIIYVNLLKSFINLSIQQDGNYNSSSGGMYLILLAIRISAFPRAT
jgi:hypothetical protein